METLHKMNITTLDTISMLVAQISLLLAEDNSSKLPVRSGGSRAPPPCHFTLLTVQPRH